MKYFNLSLIIFVFIFISGCNSLNKQELQLRHEGIIDACYTVLEYNPEDKESRINTYLEQKEKAKQITASEKQIIKACLKRTESSKKWLK